MEGATDGDIVADESSDCDMDEHDELADGSITPAELIQSPSRMNPTARLNICQNLSAIIEEKSLSSSGRVSVDQQFMSPDLLIRRHRNESGL